MRRRIILYTLGGLLALCLLIGILAPKTTAPSPTTEPAQRAATIAQATNTPAPSPTTAPTQTAVPTPSPTRAPSSTPVPTAPPPTKAPPTSVPATAAPAASCPGGCTEQKEGCTIKGNVNSKGEKIYHLPGMAAYSNTKVQIDEGDRWFCTAAEAQAAGFRRAGQ